MINKLEQGSGVGFSIVIDGEIVDFRLAVLARKMWRDEEELVYGFVSESGLYASGTYSGGRTGMGVSNYDAKKPIPEDHRLVTTDLAEIARLADESERKQEADESEWRKGQEDKVRRINALPTEFQIGHVLLDKVLVFRRSEASFDRRMSRSIRGGDISIEYKNSERSYFFVSDYVARGSKALLVKKFAGEMVRLLGEDIAHRVNPKETLRRLVDRRDELKEMVRNA